MELDGGIFKNLLWGAHYSVLRTSFLSPNILKLKLLISVGLIVINRGKRTREISAV